MKADLNHFLTTTNWSMYSADNEVQFFAVAKESETGAKLGMIQFIASPMFAHGNFRISLYDGVNPTDKKRGLEKLLLSTIFKLVPNTSRVFFHTRKTNEEGINAHLDLGFTQFHGDLANWTDLEYIAAEKDLLQNTAKTFVDI